MCGNFLVCKTDHLDEKLDKPVELVFVLEDLHVNVGLHPLNGLYRTLNGDLGEPTIGWQLGIRWQFEYGWRLWRLSNGHTLQREANCFLLHGGPVGGVERILEEDRHSGLYHGSGSFGRGGDVGWW